MSQFYTAGPAETQAWSKALAKWLEPGDFLALRGDLGAGKTCLVQGLAQGLGSPGPVTSPTFGLIHEYQGGRLPLYHFDVYRLSQPAELEGLGFEDYFYGDGLCVVEWGEKVAAYLPPGRLDIVLSPYAGGRLLQAEALGKTKGEMERADRLRQALAGPEFASFRLQAEGSSAEQGAWQRRQDRTGPEESQGESYGEGEKHGDSGY